MDSPAAHDMANRDRTCRWPAVRIADVAFGKLDDCMQSTSISLGKRPIIPAIRHSVAFGRRPASARWGIYEDSTGSVSGQASCNLVHSTSHEANDTANRTYPRHPRSDLFSRSGAWSWRDGHGVPGSGHQARAYRRAQGCLLYTSDAADDLLCVDLG